MCLKTTNDIIESTTEAVECYKVLCVWEDKDNYWSPTFFKEWVIGARYKEERLVVDTEVSDGYTRFHRGFHACLTYDGAVEYMKRCIERSEPIALHMLDEIVIVKCHVPIGASYCVGKSDWCDIDEMVCWEIETSEVVGRFVKHGSCIVPEQLAKF
jgi:hypothetical protein